MSDHPATPPATPPAGPPTSVEPTASSPTGTHPAGARPKETSVTIGRYGPVRLDRRGRRHRIVWKEHGERHERSVADEADARAFAQAVAERLAHQAEVSAAAVTPTTTVAALFARILDDSDGRSPDWQADLEGMIRNHILPVLAVDRRGRRRLCRELDGDLIRQCLNRLADAGYSQSTIDLVADLIRRAVREGMLYRVWPVDPWAKVKVPVGRGRETGLRRITRAEVPSTAQVELLAETLAGLCRPWGTMTRIAGYCGLRFSELVSLRPCDVLVDERTIVVRRQLREVRHRGLVAKPVKSAGLRRLPYDPDDETTWPAREVIVARHLVDEVAELTVGGPADRLLFTTAKGFPLRRSNWRGPLRDAYAAQGGHPDRWPDGMRWHCLRHHTAVWWIDQGVTIKDVSSMLGHSTSQVTETVYYHWTNLAADRVRRMI